MPTDDPRPLTGDRVSRQQRRADARSRRKRERRNAVDLAAGAAIALGAAALAAPAGAATIAVNSTADVVADDGACTLREAINSANTDTASGITAGECIAGAGLDTVDMTSLSGTILIKPFSAGPAYGPLGVYTSMNLTGPGAGTLSISGGGATGIFYMYAADAPQTPIGVSGLTLENGLSTSPGGAIRAIAVPYQMALTISDTVFSGNVSPAGGALTFSDLPAKYAAGTSGGSLTITNSTFTNNIANIAPVNPPPDTGSGGPGGAIFVKYAGPGTTVTLDHTTISGNRSRFDGGAIAALLYCSADMAIKNSVITGNDAGIVQPDIGTSTFSGNGGGIFVASAYYSYYYYGGLAAAKKAVISARRARASAAGGKPRAAIYNCDNVTITDSTISNNTSDRAGGGLAAFGSGVVLDRTTISGNTADGGGGAAFYYSNDVITNSTIANNNALYYGGGILGFNDKLSIDNATITGNSSPANVGEGVTLYGYYSGTINNSIVANNGTSQIAGDLTVTFTDVFPADASPTWTDGGNNKSVDPLLGPLAQNGTPNQGNGNTNAPLVEIPQAGSQVIDAGDTATAAGTIDERGSTRVRGAAVDMGSVETLLPGTVTTNPTITVNENAGTVTITLNRTGGSDGALTVNYSTAPGTATSPGDFGAATGTVTWADGDAAPKTITISIVSDTTPEPPEIFTVNLSTATPGATVANPTVTITIIDPLAVPTLAFWMKLMLALTCAGVGVVMLKNGRLLVVVLAAGVALTAAPSLHAAAAPQARVHAGPRREPLAVGTIVSMSSSGNQVMLKIGTTDITVNRRHLAVIDARKGRKRGSLDELTPGTPVLYRVVRKADGSVRRMRIGIFESVDKANAALQRLNTRRGHH